MKVVVSSQGDGLDAPASLVFGRCPMYVFVDTDTMECESLPNPAMSQGGGAGIQAAQFVLQQGARALLSGNLGPNAFNVIEAAGVPAYLLPPDMTVRQAVEAYKAGRLQPMGGASVVAHAGMRGGAGMGMGRGMRGRGRAGADAQESSAPGKEAELAELRETLKELRQQLAETMKRIENLDGEV